MAKRINVMLTDETLALLDRIAKPGERSRLVDAAVQHFVTTQGRANLRHRLEQASREWAGRELEIAEEWFPLEEEAWRTSQRPPKGRKK